MTKLGVGTLLCFAFVLLGSTSASELQYGSNDIDLVNDVNLKNVYLPEDALKININELVDISIKGIQALLKKVDPMRLLRIPLLGRGSLSKGRLNNLSQIYRSDNCSLQYAGRVLGVDLNVGWNDINIHYDYNLKLWSTQRYGTISGGIGTVKVNLGVGVDLLNFRVVLTSLKFTEVSKFYVKIEGSVGGKMRTFFVKLIMNLVRKQIVSGIEEATVDTLRTITDAINKDIPSYSRQFTFSYPDSAHQLDIDALQYVEIEH